MKNGHIKKNSLNTIEVVKEKKQDFSFNHQAGSNSPS
jgi:hypothetical protein